MSEDRRVNSLGCEMLSAVALLGRRDYPTDGIQDYCTFLSKALQRHEIQLQQVNVEWFEKGWFVALRKLFHSASDWRGKWVILQYTSLAWSRRGFPLGALAAFWILRRKGARVATLFHDTLPFAGDGFYNRIRTRVQIWIMRTLAVRSLRAISALPIERMPWAQVRSLGSKFTTIPIGAAIPETNLESERPRSAKGAILTVAVFGITARDSQSIQGEVSDIAHAVKRAAESTSPLRLIALGRGSAEAENALKEALAGVNVEISVLGLQPPHKIAETLAAADAMLFVRGYISGRRSSAIAGIVSGLPVVAYSGPETCFPVTEAGVELAPEGDREALATALARVFTEYDFRQELRRRSACARTAYFSWSKIAQQYAASVITS
jgi:glycosyltransferase involved in cell wall biosynthesis